MVVVNESGASIYSASKRAREEFPNLDVTVRGAISIARRLQDPLAELVKTEPKSIGVGQYQHDVDQKKLKRSLAAAVESCVNRVGVDLNTASVDLLKYVSGIGDKLAQNIVAYPRSTRTVPESRTAAARDRRIWRQDLRAGRRIPANQGRRKSARSHCRASGVVFARRAHGDLRSAFRRRS